MESPGNICERSWNFLGYDVVGGHNAAGADAKISSNFICICGKNRWWPGLCSGPHSNCCLYLYLNITGVRQGPRKILLGFLEVLEIFVTKTVGTLVTGVVSGLLKIWSYPEDSVLESLPNME